MEEPVLKSTQSEEANQGRLQINVTASVGLIPIENASITISFTGEPDSTVETLTTDSSGQTDTVELETPPLQYSLTPNSPMPYSEYTVSVTAPGYEPVIVSGVEVLPDVTAIQNVEMTPTEMTEDTREIITIPDHTLYGDYPPKIPEDEIKPMDETGEIVLSRVVIPSCVKYLQTLFHPFPMPALFILFSVILPHNFDMLFLIDQNLINIPSYYLFCQFPFRRFFLHTQFFRFSVRFQFSIQHK